MRVAFIMLRKEWVENIRKSRLLVMFAVFMLFAVTSPLTAKYLSEIIAFLLKFSDDVMQIPIQLPAPTIYDSYIQWYQNLAQMGILVQIFVFMGMVSDEKTSGSVILILTKAVPRHIFILDKFFAASGIVMATLFPSFIVFYYYTTILFDKRPAASSWMGFLVFCLFSLFILSLTVFASTISKKTSISALLALGGYFSMSVLSALPLIGKFFPTKLTQAAYEISAGVSDVTDFLPAILVAFMAMVLLLLASVASFRKQEL